MTRGIVMFAHNSREVDYGLMSMISANLASKNLSLPVSLITDRATVNWMKESRIYDRARLIFDHIIETDLTNTGNQRRLHDGLSSKMVPFQNYSRADAWHLTPYDHTLLIDTDYLLMTDKLNHHWDVDSDLQISSGIKDIVDQHRLGYQTKFVSDTGIWMFWATTVMFKKTEQTLLYFDLIDFIRRNYKYYSDLFRFDGRQYRNDRSFSVAKHICDGFETDFSFSLPPILTALDKDILYDVDEQGKMIFLLSSKDDKFFPCAVKNLDIHIMNKQSLIRNAEKLLDIL
jgi:hypothetical protein